MIQKIIDSICPIPIRSLEKIEAILTFESVEKGGVFIALNQVNKKEYFLLEGICRSFLLHPRGDEITLSFFNSESVLSPHTTRTLNEKSILNFQALTPLRLATVDAGLFEELMVQDLDIREMANTVLRVELLWKVKKEIGMASLTARERLLQFRKQFPLLENQVAHTDIASYLGITNVSLSRLRRSTME